MRDLLLRAIVAAVLAAALETLAVVLGWDPATWVLLAMPAAAGIAAFLVAGRLRAVRRSARRRTRARRVRSKAGRSGARGPDRDRNGSLTAVQPSREPVAAHDAGPELVPVPVDEERLVPR